MALHAPTIHTPQAVHIPGWLVVPALALAALLVLGILAVAFPAAEPTAPDEAYQQYRAGERSLVLDAATIQAIQDYRAGERDMK